MTVRAILLGLLAAVALAAVGYINDIWLLFPAIGGNLMPGHAFGLLTIGVLIVNPLLGLIGRWRFRGGEIVVMLALVLMGSVIAGSGLLWVFPHPIITPIQDHATHPGWADKKLLGYVPEVMLVRAQPASPVVVEYLRGKGHAGRWLPPGDVPWGNWAPALAFWFSVLALNFVAGLAGVVLVHRQWSKREHLAFPIAVVTAELLAPPEEGRLFNRTIRTGRFWIGFALAFGVLLINGIQAWRPGFVAVPLGIDLRPFQDVLGAVAKVPWVNLLNVRFYFAAVGIAYFLTSEASFSLGLSAWLYVLAAAPLVAAGVDVQTDVLAGGLPAYMYFGAYMGLTVMVLYLGRSFYASVLLRSLGLGRGSEQVLPREVAAGRVLLLASGLLVVLLWWVGLHPLLAGLFVLLTGALFLMIGRINVTTGLFIIQPFWHPGSILAAIFGSLAIGPRAVIILALLSVVVTIDPRIAVVPLGLNAVHLGEQHRLRPGRLAAWMAVAVILAMVVAVPVTVYVLYDLGVSGTGSEGTRWAVEDVARMPFRMLERSVDELDAADTLQDATAPPTLARLLHPEPKRHFFAAAGIGFALVMLCSWLRLRFTRWPLHPMLFLVWGSRWTTEFAPSFLLAWLIKSAITRYGGLSTYRRLRPFFIGLMAGEFASGILWSGIGVGYYALTGTRGASFRVRP